MYAVIKTGGKQYRVAEGEVLKVEKLAGEAGDSVTLDQVLMVGDGDTSSLGSPLVEGASVAAEILEQDRADKIIVFKKKRRQGYRRKAGHRQDITVLRINEILTDGKKPTGKKAESKKAGAPKKADKAVKSEPKAETASEAAHEVTPVAPELLSAPNGEADDLKKIGGVGPKLEEKLNALGIYHYSQIAAFTEENCAYVDEQLGFKDRVGKDDWVGQAKSLMAEQDS